MRCAGRLAACAIVIWTSSQMSGQAFSESVPAAVRVQNRRGFAVPGKDIVAQRKPESITTVDVDGAAVDVHFYSDLPIWNKRAHRYLATPVTFAFVADKSVVIETRELVTQKLWQYSVGGKIFMYSMWAYPLQHRP
jgi:hypothetical protein